MEEYFQDTKGLPIERARADFESVWKVNIQQVELIREKNPQAGDYFHEDEENIILRKKIWLNVQGTRSKAYQRQDQGIVTTDSSVHAYALWDEDIENLDVIKIGKDIYRIQNYNEGMDNGQVVFKEFDLLKIDQESTSVGVC